jgi:PPK2 family polyphosphate:nucleotide phosphotransferase
LDEPASDNLIPLRRGKNPATGVVISQPGRKTRLGKIDPAGKAGWIKDEADRRTLKMRERLAELQMALYAEQQRSLLIVFQAMDTGGKDGAIKNICHGLDPNGMHLTNFKYPSLEEWDHDFLWRVHHAAPRKGVIGIWNRSHYEDVLVPRVLEQISVEVWRQRCEDIRAFEKMLGHNGVTILKFFLHISKEEQKERLEARLQDPQKLWKFNPADLKARALWGAYQSTYEEVIDLSTTKDAPWHIVPANRKWVRNLVVLHAVVETLEKMKPRYPVPGYDPASIVIE